MALPEPKRSRAILAGWLAAVFSVSAVADWRVLAVLCAAAPLVLWRGAGRAARRMALSVLPLTLLLIAASFGWRRLTEGEAPPLLPFVALLLRTALIAFLTFSALARADLFRALAPFPTLTRLLAMTLAQFHALRLLATDSLQGLRSRLPRAPRTLDVVRGAGGVSAALLTLSLRNARETTDALRSRGF